MSETREDKRAASNPTYIVIDCNEWIRLKWLGSPIGLVLLSTLKQSPSLALAIPEVLEGELDKHRVRAATTLLNNLKAAIAEVGVTTGNPLAGGIVTISEESIEVAIRQRLTGIADRIVYPELTIAEARNALARINSESPPNGPKNQQAKDSLLWEACLSLSDNGEVYFITGDGGFYKNRKPDSGLAENLAGESSVLAGRIHVFASLEEAMQIFAPESSAGSVEATGIDLEATISGASLRIFEHSATARDLLVEPSLRGVFLKHFRTDEPHVFAVSFTAFYLVRAPRIEESEAAISGECVFDTKKADVSNITFSSLDWKIKGLSDREIWTKEMFL